MPLVVGIVAIAVLLLLHVPPLVASAREVVKPAQTLVVPVMTAGNGFTNILVVEIQPVLSIYVMVAVPTANPVITPVLASTEAIPEFEEVHTPPVFPLLVNVVVPPTHIVWLPLKVPAFGACVSVSVTAVRVLLTHVPLWPSA